jgi:hypothetical protein
MVQKRGQKRKDFQELFSRGPDKPYDVNFWLDGYDDLFSDFDHRSYLQRALSYDFLFELKRATKDISDKVKLKFYITNRKRNRTNEQLIEHRLVEHFNKHFNLLNKEKNNIILMGAVFIFLGLILMFGASYLLYLGEAKTLFLSFILILLEPGGWFLFWEGLYLIVFDAKKLNPEIEFYKKMHNGSIYFYSY